MVQQLVEKYDYDLNASIEAVQLFGTKERAMDYLARKEVDSEDEETITQSVATTEPTAEERYKELDFNAIANCLLFNVQWKYCCFL